MHDGSPTGYVFVMATPTLYSHSSKTILFLPHVIRLQAKSGGVSTKQFYVEKRRASRRMPFSSVDFSERLGSQLFLSGCDGRTELFQIHLGAARFREHLSFFFFDVMIDVFRENFDRGIVQIFRPVH